MKVAIVHEWLTTWAGSELVLEQMIACYPQADLFAVIDFLEESHRPRIQGKRARTTFIQRLPFARTRFWNYLPLMPLAVEQLDLSGYDLVISNSHAFAKGVLTGPDQVHVSYVHSPMRYAWDLQHQYLRHSDMGYGARGPVARLGLHYLRLWDSRTANGVDAFAVNSHYVARRLWKTYRREATVIHPPVDTERFTLNERKDDYYLCASRMVSYKRMDLVVQAFGRMPDKTLLVIGDGPERRRVQAGASSNVKFLGYQTDDALREHLQKAKALVFAAEEDFGILPVEAQACGTPVIAYGKGGVSEIVRRPGTDHPTGILFMEQTDEAIVDAVLRFERISDDFTPAQCRQNALRFGSERFRIALRSLVEASLNEYTARRPSSDAVPEPTKVTLE